jgi:hypothetical protein
MSKNYLNSILLYTHVFFLSVGTNTLSLKFGYIPILDVILVIYFFINFKSISVSVKYIKDILFVLLVFVFLQFISTFINSFFIINTTPDNVIGLLQYISYFMILIVYFDFLINNPKKFNYILIIFLLGIVTLLIVDIYVANQITNYNFFERYGRYIFAEKYSDEEYCISTIFCYQLENVNTLSSYVGIVSFLIFGFLMNPYRIDDLKFKLILIFYLIIFSFIAVGFGQKTAYLPYVMLTILGFFYIFYSNLIIDFSIFKLFLPVSLIVLVIIIFDDTIFSFFDTIYFRTFDESRIGSFITRFDFAANALNLISNPISLFIGNGKDSYFFAEGINDPHNINAQFFLETGIIGFVLYSYIIYQLILNSYRHGQFFMLSFVIMYLSISNANGLAFQSHTAWISFAIIMYLGNKQISLK